MHSWTIFRAEKITSGKVCYFHEMLYAVHFHSRLAKRPTSNSRSKLQRTFSWTRNVPRLSRSPGWVKIKSKVSQTNCEYTKIKLQTFKMSVFVRVYEGEGTKRDESWNAPGRKDGCWEKTNASGGKLQHIGGRNGDVNVNVTPPWLFKEMWREK